MEEIIKLHPQKGAKGEAWEYKCSQHNSLKTIYVSQLSDSIEFLQFVRVDCITGERYPSSGYETVSGNKFNVVELGSNEELISVSGHHVYDYAKDEYVLKSITFGTDRSSYGPFGGTYRSSYGPFGGDTAVMTSEYGLDMMSGNGGEFKFEMGRSFGGFHGTIVGGRLESIGVFIRVV